MAAGLSPFAEQKQMVRHFLILKGRIYPYNRA
jgi:hypothetical protein